jgi:hypothetical protein
LEGCFGQNRSYSCAIRRGALAIEESGDSLPGPFVRHRPETGLDVIAHMFGLPGSGNDASDSRVAEHEFEQDLSPALAANFAGPVR